MQSDSTTDLVRREEEYTPSITSQQDLPEYSPPDPSPRYKSVTAGRSKNPLKRLGAALKNELEEIKALQNMTPEEIRAHNREIMERHVKKQDEKEKRMQEKYGAVGRIVARSTRTTLDRKWPVCSLALANSGGLDSGAM